MHRIYLDHSATTPLAPEVFEAMRPHFLETYGNASSVHAWGRKARAILEESRDTIAKGLGARSDEIFFTSGGTESNNHAVKGVLAAAQKAGRNRLIVTAIEHHAVLQPAESLKATGVEVNALPVGGDGVVDLEALKKALTPRTALVSLMHANNEVGTIEPVREASDLTHASGALVHSDAVQSVGKIPVDVNALGVDLLTLSAHKLYGPKGIGALFIRKGTAIAPFIEGGGQEQNRRAGTENVPLAVGFAKALSLSLALMDEEGKRLRKLRTTLLDQLKDLKGLLVNTPESHSLPHILSISFDSSAVKVDGEALIMGMDLNGVAVTSGSACTSGTLDPSHVLMAMGRDEKTARATIRFSMGRSTTEGEIDVAVKALRNVLKTMKV